MQNIKLTIAYNGSCYRGWQATKTGKTIEGELKQIIEGLLGHSVRLQAASRTDAGVHAHGQVVNFFSTELSIFSLSQLQEAINEGLPPDIVVRQASIMPLTFHPTIDAIGKEYRYWLTTEQWPWPHRRAFCWHRPGTALNAAAMQHAAAELLGEHDFSALCNMINEQEYADHQRRIDAIELEKTAENEWCFIVRGNHFLYKMVRNIVGLLVYIGEGRLPRGCVGQILQSKQRCRAAITAPACGLSLYRVLYA